MQNETIIPLAAFLIASIFSIVGTIGRREYDEKQYHLSYLCLAMSYLIAGFFIFLPSIAYSQPETAFILCGFFVIFMIVYTQELILKIRHRQNDAPTPQAI
jgi:uncharacterized membrane protein HdeD (DUF308 family)